MTTTASTDTAPRYTVEKDDNGWHVVASDGNGWNVASRQAGRDMVRQLREQDAATEARVRDEAAAVIAARPDTATSITEARAAVGLDTPELDGPALDAATRLAATADRTKAATHQRVTLARVTVGDRLMTNLVTEGNGIVYAAPHRFSDGQVRTVAEVGSRKAVDPEMPGTLYTLVFTDGMVSEERYGTTSHYPAEVFDGPPATPAPEQAPQEAPAKPAPAPARPAKATAKATAKAEKVPTTPGRAGKLTKGSRLVLRDLGVVTVDGISKTGGGKLEVAYTGPDGEAGVREMWGSTNVRLAAGA